MNELMPFYMNSQFFNFLRLSVWDEGRQIRNKRKLLEFGVFDSLLRSRLICTLNNIENGAKTNRSEEATGRIVLGLAGWLAEDGMKNGMEGRGRGAAETEDGRLSSSMGG